MFKRIIKGVTALTVLLIVLSVAAFFIADYFYPLPMHDDSNDYAKVITAADGTPMRAFADGNGVWRYPVSLDDVSPLYIEALLSYEDRWFWQHPGVNPVALIRATIQNARHGRVISGGSTLTMQVARLIDPHERTVSGKIKQIFRALQLEYHFSKQEILTLYLNRAPFGGPIEGVEAASYTYLGKSSKELSHSEAALLAVLPQAPTRLRPDKHPEKATQARNKILQRLNTLGVWSQEIYDDALLESVIPRFNQQPMLAPLLARRLKQKATHSQALRTTIDTTLQAGIESLVHNYVANLPPGTSAAVLVARNDDYTVRAYVGSADFHAKERFGHVDMIKAIRSPGSTLKPFLYGIAMDVGLIHSASLLIDVPQIFDGYRPNNFTNGFSGPVGVTDALQRSLNIPATQVLHHLGPKRFAAALENGGIRLYFPTNSPPNLSLILGGVGAKLEDIVSAYIALARDGITSKLRYTQDDKIQERRLLSKEAAWIIRKILQETPRPDRPASHAIAFQGPKLAWKTGTSYGYRDTWSIGVTAGHTIGVWVGRPDGTPLPGHYGRVTAAPLLFLIADNLMEAKLLEQPVPDLVSQEKICWPLGTKKNLEQKSLCHQEHSAWVINNNIPPTLINLNETQWLTNPLKITLNKKTKKLVDANCSAKETIQKEIALWPKAVEPWIARKWRRSKLIPAYDETCKNVPSLTVDGLKITSIAPGTILRQAPGKKKTLPATHLRAIGGFGKRYWFINGKLEYAADYSQVIPHAFDKPGKYQITVLDEQGNSDLTELEVQFLK